MLDILLSSVDAPGGYESATISCALQPSAMKGLDYGGQATVLNAMKILQQSWEWDHKYAYSHSIACCWRKADILPASWNTDINNTLAVNCYRIRTNKYHLYNTMNESYY